MPRLSPLPRCLYLATALAVLLPILAHAAQPQAPIAADIAWLRRDGFDLDAAQLQRLRTLGRNELLRAQLDDRLHDPLPPAIDTLLRSYPALNDSPRSLLEEFRQRQEQIKAMPEGEARNQAQKDLRQYAAQLAEQTQSSVLLQAVYGPNQLKEQLVLFWLNHFSVFQGKGRVRLLTADYLENTLRPHALGKFKDLLLATLQSPAMLEYLDNSSNARGKVNENYARELMELHSLGVDAGYSQEDVQQLALILTGAGLAPLDGREQHFPRNLQPLVVQQGLFQFNPKRHDFSDKHLLGHTIRGSGYDEITQAVDLITRQPACARFISRKLAQYFVADEPPPALVARMAKSFSDSDGDIAQVMATLMQSPELLHTAGKKFKDPQQFVVSALRLTYDGKPLANPRPLLNWLNQMGQPLFGRITPDGWPLVASGWSSSGQMAKRFEIARAMGSGNNRLFTAEGSQVPGPGFPMITTPMYYQAIAPYLSSTTRNALEQAVSPQEWNTFLLSSPDFNNR
ncbi:hypothetical protein PPC_1476 [Pseudomonas protegens Cab57]|uniref:DUF1800 domain-containing protein n=1 Tax=Pseudomonas protegens TaxID=380021 RepID=UPI0004425D9D|nr:DUF1800 domain-containing protein [Pseudomonas protegens]WRV93110.1 DUF1800 domain-containing protein [Pseudomonas protegens]BAO60823.1 hypothetical protein PPC_1476 [Pseudomonas protegens Cab57]